MFKSNLAARSLWLFITSDDGTGWYFIRAGDNTKGVGKKQDECKQRKDTTLFFKKLQKTMSENKFVKTVLDAATLTGWISKKWSKKT